jgi:hypothetical protein
MELKAEEISQIIKEQIADYDKKVELSETGVVLSVGDGIARIYGLQNAMALELVLPKCRSEKLFSDGWYQPWGNPLTAKVRLMPKNLAGWKWLHRELLPAKASMNPATPA